MSSSSSPTSSQVGAAATGGSSSGVVRRRRSGRRRRPRTSATDYNINLPYDHHHQQLLQQEEFIQQQQRTLQAIVAGSSSSSSTEDVWPEPFVEALVLQVAVDARSSFGRLGVAPAIALLFQVCSTWRAVSRSQYLWQTLTTRIWNRHHRHNVDHTWHEEYITWHRTARNFQIPRYNYTTLQYNTHDDDDDGVGVAAPEINLFCLRLTLSDNYLAAGFSDGSVRVFSIEPPRVHLHTFRPLPRDRLGVFSRAVMGVVLLEEVVVFGSLDGDIHVSGIGSGVTRRAYLGDVVNDGTLVDFTGSERYWVGLYAGVPGRAIHIWDGITEELLFIGGTLTDQEAVIGWHLLTDLTTEVNVGRIRIIDWERAVACTSLRTLTFSLRHQGVVISDSISQHGNIVATFDSSTEEGVYVMVDRRGVASVRRGGNVLEEVCRFSVRSGGVAVGRGLLGAMNGGCVVICAAVTGVMRIWDVENGELYSFRERVVGGEVTYLSASERHVAAVTSGDASIIHLWDFGA